MAQNTTLQQKTGAEAIRQKGWLVAHKWLLLRRLTQLSVIALFLVGPLMGIWILKGNMASSLLLDTVPLSDPFVFVQTLFAGQQFEQTLFIGALIVALFYFVLGGRVYCAWVCPINIVTDAADWLRRLLNIRTSVTLSRHNRSLLLVAILLASLVSGVLVWELVNPVTMFQRELVFGMGFSWVLVTVIFLLDLLISKRAWCGHLCPMGRFYSLVGRGGLVKVNAAQRNKCDDCMDCFAVCPEPQVIKPALKGAEGSSPVILSSDCTNCGQCIDVCAKDVFSMGHRFKTLKTETSQREVSL